MLLLSEEIMLVFFVELKQLRSTFVFLLSLDVQKMYLDVDFPVSLQCCKAFYLLERLQAVGIFVCSNCKLSYEMLKQYKKSLRLYPTLLSVVLSCKS